MHYVFDTSRRLLLDDRGIAVKKLYIKRYDKIDWDIDIVGGGTSVGFTAGRFDATGVIPLIKTSSPVSGGKATLTPQSNTSGLRDMLIIDGVMQPSVEFPGEFIVSDADGKRVASINIPVEFAAAIDSPDAVVEEIGRATLTASMTTLPAGTQGTIQVEPTANGWHLRFAMPQGEPGKDGQDGKDGAPGGVASINGLTGPILLGNNLSMVGNTINASGGLVDLSDYDGPVRLKRNGQMVLSILTEKDMGGGTDESMVYVELNGLGGPVAIRSAPDGGESDPTLVNIDGMVSPGADLSAYVKKTDYATGTKYGLVKIGSNISVSNGMISLPYASTSSYGVMRVGSNLSVTSGIVSGQSSGGSSGGVESINGLTGALELRMGIMSHPEDSEVMALYVYAMDAYGNRSEASGAYMIGLYGAASGPYTQCLDITSGSGSGALDLSNYQGNIHIKDAQGRDVLKASYGNVEIGSGIGKITLYGPSTTLEVTGGINFSTQGGMYLNGTKIHN